MVFRREVKSLKLSEQLWPVHITCIFLFIPILFVFCFFSIADLF